jgi:hypothetical protein
MSEDITVYITNCVITPATAHRTAVTDLNSQETDEIQRQWMTAVKYQTALSRSTPDALMWSPEGYRLRSLGNALIDARIVV